MTTRSIGIQNTATSASHKQAWHQPQQQASGRKSVRRAAEARTENVVSPGFDKPSQLLVQDSVVQLWLACGRKTRQAKKPSVMMTGGRSSVAAEMAATGAAQGVGPFQIHIVKQEEMLTQAMG